MSTLVNKLATVILKTDRQYNYHIKRTDFKTECLIQVLSLQATTQLKIRLTANNFMLYREIFNSLNQKIISSDIFINEFMLYSSLNFSKKNTIIFNLIKNAQEFDSQYR